MPTDPARALKEAFSKELMLWRQLRSVAQEFLAEASKGWNRAMQDTSAGLLKLAGHGWYLPGSVDWDVPVLLARDEDMDWGTIDAEMCELWSQELDAAQEDLLQAHPRRAALLRQAFAAHEAEQFFLSVPAFLSQADGVCFELIGEQLFAKGGNGMRLHDAITADDSISSAFLSPLATVQPIAWSSTRRSSEPGQLNRHAVLHGEDVEYGTEVNSLKALSLLSYVSSVLGLAKRDRKPSDPNDG